MLGEDFSTRRSSGNSAVFAGLVLVKVLRSLSLCQGFSFLFDDNFPVILYTFFLCAGSALFMWLLQRPWVGKKSTTSSQWTRVAFYAFLLVINLLLWNFGLKYYGPTRALLSSDYAEVALSLIVATFLPSQASGKPSGRIQGAALIIVGYLILYFADSGYPLMHHILPAETITIGGGAEDMAAATKASVLPPAAHSFDFGPISIPESKVGGAAIFLAIIVATMRKNFAKRLQADIGGERRLYALAMGMAALMLSPLAVISYFSSEIEPTVATGSILMGFACLVLFSIVGEFYAESFAHKTIGPSQQAKIGLAASFIAAYFGERFWGFTPGTILPWFCFFLVFGGLHLLLQKKSVTAMPMFSGNTNTVEIMSLDFFKMSMAQILEGKASRRIFLYLSINLMFMFVEVVYGYLTNSLGLISDACHMLFDSTALAIGLVASIVSKRPANDIFSYGYGRVENLSGFINGIFLVFIGGLVLTESAERFYHPQEINTDNLLLVSCLGLGVNLIGVFAFHDLHDHGDHGDDEDEGGGHSHGHGGHSHGHSHGHKEGQSNANLYGVYLHILADTLGSVGVICSSLMVSYWGWTIADPICSFCISLLIFVSVVPLLKGSAMTLLQTTPGEFDEKYEKCLKQISTMEGVIQISNPHFWKVAKSNIIGTMQVQIRKDVSEQTILAQVMGILKKKGVKQATVEIVK
eukprot:TRINITY_DN4457_c0_g1_i1.p1 TRINITY_DN4457_c0_g1~~TRINITY_DN4457_c0_g1_i1.p1  ORF type:complete len:694 (-),score=148.99 TRINITY_DN4457_c0_g1_i1:60-2141(-)